MRPILTVLAGVMLASSAWAQIQPPPPIMVPPVKRDPHPAHDPSVYVNGAWILPNLDQEKAYRPERASQDGVGGSVTIDCLVGVSGYLTECDVIDETPQGYGFANATVAMFLKYVHVDPATVTGGLHSWSRKRFTYGWSAG